MKYLVVLLLMLCSLPAQALEPRVERRGGEGEPRDVAMVLWRGVTDAERGFMDYFDEREIPVRLRLYDADKDPRRLEEIVATLKGEPPALIYAFGTTVSTALVGEQYQTGSEFIQDTPVVFNIVADPLGAGLSHTLEGSGRNLTGVSHVVPMATQLKAMLSLGEYRRIGVVFNPLEANSVLAVEALERGLADEGVELLRAPFATDGGQAVLDSLQAQIARLRDGGAELVYLPSDSFLISHAAWIVEELHRAGLPTFSATESPIRRGGAWMGLVSHYYSVGKFAGYKAEQILVQGRDPGELPIETLARYTFLVNLPSMRRLAHYPPVPVLQFAEVVGD